jgi:glutamine---fructose-6-phosphate transaminase (isomerizing)
MNPARFLADLEARPVTLDALATALAVRNPFADVPREVDRVLFLGMGSSRFAALDAALDLRSDGIPAVAEYASVEASFPPDRRTLVVAISASGESAETLAAVERYRDTSPTVVITNAAASSLARTGRLVVEMLGATSVAASPARPSSTPRFCCGRCAPISSGSRRTWPA